MTTNWTPKISNTFVKPFWILRYRGNVFLDFLQLKLERNSAKIDFSFAKSNQKPFGPIWGPNKMYTNFNLNFSFRRAAEFADFLELNSSKYNRSARMSPFLKDVKNC